MRRLLLASLAFLLLFLPFQVGSVQTAPAPAPAPAMDCCPCSGMPSCPPACPSPAPAFACHATPAPVASPSETETAQTRVREASPAPAFIADARAESLAGIPDRQRWEPPPDGGDGQAKLRVFRI